MLVLVIFQIVKIIGSTRIFSLIEFGFDNINRLLAIGQEHKSIEILSFDIDCDKSEYYYLDRLTKVQLLLSRNRYGKFTALNSSNFLDFSNYISKMKFETGSNLFLINISSIKDSETLKNIEKQVNDISNYTSYVIFWNEIRNKTDNLPDISNKFKKLISENKIHIFVNRKINEQNAENKNILFEYNFFGIINLVSLYFLYSLFNFFSVNLKKIYKILFKFKY